MKMTFHTRDARKFTRDAAVEIVRSYGGDIHETALMVAGAFDFVFHFVHLRSANKKVLSRIYELGVNDGSEYMNEICAYDIRTDTWKWSDAISEEKRRYGEEEDPEAYAKFKDELHMLSNCKSAGLPRRFAPRNDERFLASEARACPAPSDTQQSPPPVIASEATWQSPPPVIARSEATWQSSDKENPDAI
jgi:hypothetical protein